MGKKGLANFVDRGLHRTLAEDLDARMREAIIQEVYSMSPLQLVRDARARQL